MAASRAVRGYYHLERGIALHKPASQEEGAAGLPPVEEGPYSSLLLPRLCINRRYVAEGVRVHACETWKMVVGERGREVVASLAEPFV